MSVCNFDLWYLGEQERAHLVVQLLNLLRASFSPIFQYFSAVNDTRVSFSPIFHFNISLTCMPCAMDSSAMEARCRPLSS